MHAIVFPPYVCRRSVAVPSGLGGYSSSFILPPRLMYSHPEGVNE